MPTDIDDPNESIDGILDVLCNKRRRMLIRLIAIEPLCPRAAAGDIAAVEEDNPTSDDRHAVYVALQQTHIPACVDEDILEVKQQTDTLRPGSAFQKTARILACLDDELS